MALVQIVHYTLHERFTMNIKAADSNTCTRTFHTSSFFQDVCRCLGADSAEDAIRLCVCSDHLSDPETYRGVTPAVLSQLTTWWKHRVARAVDTHFTDNLYLDIVAR